MTKKELTDEEKYQIKEFFDMFDKNQDGLISAEELKEVLEAFDGTSASDEDILKFIEAYDANKDGELNFEEFIQWWTQLDELGSTP